MYAVGDRVCPQNLCTNRPQKPLASLSMVEFLPTPKVQEQFIGDLADIIPRILVKYLNVYKPLHKAITNHIPHPHTKEMDKKSDWVSKDNYNKLH